MKHRSISNSLQSFFAGSIFVMFALVAGIVDTFASPAQNTAVAAPQTPSQVVRAFHRALRERRFRDAFAMSVLHHAIKELNAEEFDDFKIDFERIAAGMPDEDHLTGEQISGDQATVFVNFGDMDKPDIKPVELILQNGAWIVGSRRDLDAVKNGGKKFLFEQRIETHHEDVKLLMNRLVAAEFVYSSQHGGAFGSMNQLIDAGLVPKDLLGNETTGYNFRITVSKDGKSYGAFAEPARYGRSGRISYAIDQSGQLQSKDVGGKPLKLTR